MAIHSFETEIEQEGQFTFVSVPFSPREVWGPRPRFRVNGTIDGIEVRGTLGALGTAYFLRLSKKWIRTAGLEAGARVRVQLDLDEQD